MAEPIIEQTTHRWVADDGDLDNATLLGSGNGEDITLETGLDNRVRLRIAINETNGGNGVVTSNLYFSYQGGAYEPSGPATDHLRSTVSKNTTWTVTDDDSITSARLGVGIGTWANGFFDSNGVAETNLVMKNEYSELEYCIYVDDATVNDGDTIALRIYDIDVEIDVYGDTPVITVDKAVADPAPSVSDGLTVGDNITTFPLALGSVSISDGLTVGDLVDSIEVVAGTPDDRDITDIADGLTVGESVAAQMQDLGANVADGLTLGESTSASLDDLVLSVSDGLIVGESVTVTPPFEPNIPIDLGVDNLSVWRQGVVVYG
jgi:hypothetical protein